MRFFLISSNVLLPSSYFIRSNFRKRLRSSPFLLVEIFHKVSFPNSIVVAPLKTFMVVSASAATFAPSFLQLRENWLLHHGDEHRGLALYYRRLGQVLGKWSTKVLVNPLIQLMFTNALSRRAQICLFPDGLLDQVYLLPLYPTKRKHAPLRKGA